MSNVKYVAEVILASGWGLLLAYVHVLLVKYVNMETCVSKRKLVC